MKGKLEKIGNEWYVKYVHYDGGGSFRLPLHPDDQGYMNCFLYVDKDTEVDYKEMLVNPMGREVDPNNLGQNHSECIWYAKLVYDEDGVKDKQKLSVRLENSLTNFNLTIEEVLKIDNYELKKVGFGNKSIIEIGELKLKNKQKQHLIDIMESDEELGLYDEPGVKEIKEIKLEDVFNDKKREKVKQVIHQHKVLKDLTLVNPAHLIMTSDGYGEFPDGYTLTDKGIQYIIEQLNKE